MSARAAALVATGLLLLSGRVAAEGLELWPLRVADERSVAGERRERVAGPLFESFETDDGTRGWVLRPLLGRVESGAASRLEILYPLAGWRRDESGWGLRLTPVLELDANQPRPEALGDGEAPREHAGWTALLAFGGRSESGARSFGVFPFGGVARERFGLERLDFWLFPLYARARHRSGFERHYLLWPFLSWGSGGGRRLLRIWPFFGRDVAEGRFERHFALWPVLHWRREGIGGPRDRRVRLALPLWGESVSAHARSNFLFGPLYVRSTNERTGARATDWLWPLVRFAEQPPREGRPGSREMRVEPFFRRRSASGAVRTAALLGAVERARVETEEETRSSWRLLWVSRFSRGWRREDGEERVRRDLWPLFRFQERRVGAAAPEGRLDVPWILPVGGEGWDRHWLAPLTLYERRWRGAESRSDWLWGLVRRREAEGLAFDDFGGLLRRERVEALRAD